ncbi:uracil-DNA glycosylase [Mycoplasma cottewii]|uniref:Uracil-DNA glycosylase n=1 Tax=Mycoplasma cottewii TaxID=51364 RepID=A0ABY5TWS8_9MOLU|nr:uracil-DNA glycosylase [Mycoplasma cottewii]UWD34799.1 uracil-DNA glycosylase [Mycoplasma cottewii]
MNNLNKSWNELFEKLNLNQEINNLIDQIYSDKETIFPKKEDVLKLFELSDLNNVKVVIIGQDPYHNYNQANGIAFSVTNQVKAPASLKNIFKELKSDLNIDHFTNNSLEWWVKQGVLLINTCWTVQAHKPGSHNNLGWQNITKIILENVILHNQDVIFCLWGNYAKQVYESLNIKPKHVISSAHPSPFSYKKGFENTKPFSKINNILKELDLTTIDWSK